MKKRSLVDEASNPETPFQRLLQLSWSRDRDVRRALVDNPSIAVNESGTVTNEILLKLAYEFPDEVAACSAFALFGLELKEKVMVEVAEAIAKELKDPDVITILFHELDEAADPETPFQRLLQLSQDEDPEVRWALVDNPSIAVDEDGDVTNEILLKLAKEFPDEVAACSAFALFGLELKEQVMLRVAKFIAEKAKDPGVLNLLFYGLGPDNVDVRWYIAKNPNTPMDVLRLMADKNNEPRWVIREDVAKNPNAPEDVLRFLADENNEPVADVRRYATQALKDRGLR